MKLISELRDGDHFKSQFLVVSANRGVTNAGLQYLNMELRDASGSMGAKKWEISPSDLELLVQGNILEFEGDVILFKDNLQMKILGVSPVNADEVDAMRFVKAPPIPQEQLEAKLNSYIKEIKDPDFLKLLDYFITPNKDKYFSYPAGVSVHHEYYAGLLVHVTSLLDIAKGVLPIYETLDKDLLYTGIILHDFGKLIELEGPAVYHYTVEGKLIGHISIMMGEIDKACMKLGLDGEKVILLKHMILSHHGQLEYGSPVLPCTKEALLLSFIDNLDSKMVLSLKALETVKEGEFTQKIFHLDNRMLYKQHK